MRIFHKGSKTNFVDENNVIVGWDDYGQCCEDYDWNISPILSDKDLLGYNFDPSYFQDGHDGEDYYSGGFVRFRLVDGEGNEAFLQLSNYHNGYYSHGFSMHTEGNNGITYHEGFI